MELNDTPGKNIGLWDRIRPMETDLGLLVAGLLEGCALLCLGHGYI